MADKMLTESETRIELYRIAARRLEAAQAELDRFGRALGEDPHRALSWGEGTIVAATQRLVWRVVVAWLDAPDDAALPVAQMLVNATELVVRGARCQPSSSSPLANLVEAATTAAWAAVVEELAALRPAPGSPPPAGRVPFSR